MTRLLIGPVLRHVGTTDATVWVETDGPCEVRVLDARERTWEVAGHHYALLCLDGLPPATDVPYDVRLDEERVWPPDGSRRPAPIIRTRDPDSAAVRLAFGSCRYARAATTLADRHFDPDALACLGRELMGVDARERPDLLVMLGDQVYADETTDATRRRIRDKRDPARRDGPGYEVADFEEYTWLYLESWTDPDVRWLMSTVPSVMIFDDHDVRDDWNTSHEWRLDMARTPWWRDRIAGGLASYWVYQHLGNLSPAELRDDQLFGQVRASGTDNAATLREFALHADAEADGAKPTRWSYRRDIGPVRLLMIDSRCGRILADGRRSMVGTDEFDWIAAQTAGTYEHLLIGTSLPWLLARSLHDLEAWDEALADRREGSRRQRFGERLRRAADLEHWAAFRDSFEALGALIAGVGRRPDAPAGVCVLSGDVHHAYVARARVAADVAMPVHQLTCSPLNNYVPRYMQLFFRVFWSRLAERCVRALLRSLGHVPATSIRWERLSGPHFGNELAEFVADGRSSTTVLRRSQARGRGGELREIARLPLSG